MASDALTFVIGVGSFLGLVAIAIWRRHYRLESKYSDDYYELENYRWSEFSSDLGELVAEINGLTDFDPQQADDDIPPQSEIVNVIDNEVGRSQMSEIEDSLREFDLPRELKEDAHSHYQSSYRYFAIGCVSTFLVAGYLVSADPNDSAAVIFGVIIYILLAGISKLRKAYRAERELDELIDSYRSPASP